MVCENSQQLEDINFFVKCCILDVYQNTEASVIWYSLFGKTEEANNNDSVVM